MSNYRNGYELERAARKDYEARGWFVVRAGGSKGPADLVAMCRVPGEICGNMPHGHVHVDLIQCKLDGYLPPAERKAIVALAAEVAAHPVVAYWSKDGRAARTVAFKEA